MNYCHACRRHLNGALACPGCGTSAEACRAYADSLAVEDAADTSGEEWGDTEDMTPRRSRRGRRAHRRKRRRMLYAGAGLVLAAGALSLAQVSIESPFHDSQGAAALGDGAGDGTPSGDDASSAGASSGSPSSADDPSSTGTSGSAVSAGQDGTGKHRKSADGDSKGDKGGHGDGTKDPSQPGRTGSSTPDPGSPPASDNPPPATSQPPPTTSEPDPQPTQSCTWVVVWWCS